MDRDTCLKAFRLIDQEAASRGIFLDMNVYGGAAMIFQIEKAALTHDCDVKVKGITPSEFFSLSLDIGEKLGLEPGWMNQAVSVFTSRNEKDDDFVSLDIGDHLSVHMASPKYLLAMKIMAMRTDQDSHDIKDINLLCDRLKLKSAAQALAIAKGYFPPEKIRPENIALLKEIFRKRKKTGPK